MKNLQLKRHPKFIISSLLFVFMSLLSCEKEDFSDIYEEPGYAIGTVSQYFKEPFSVTYYYTFSVAGSEYKGEYVAKGLNQLDERLIGRSYLVVYKLVDINDNTINFNYEISSEQEFNELVESFKTNPPKQN